MTEFLEPPIVKWVDPYSALSRRFAESLADRVEELTPGGTTVDQSHAVIIKSERGDPDVPTSNYTLSQACPSCAAEPWVECDEWVSGERFHSSRVARGLGQLRVRPALVDTLHGDCPRCGLGVLVQRRHSIKILCTRCEYWEEVRLTRPVRPDVTTEDLER